MTSYGEDEALRWFFQIRAVWDGTRIRSTQAARNTRGHIRPGIDFGDPARRVRARGLPNWDAAAAGEPPDAALAYAKAAKIISFEPNNLMRSRYDRVFVRTPEVSTSAGSVPDKMERER